MHRFAARRRAYFFLLNNLRLPRPIATKIVKGITRTLNPAQMRLRNGTLQALDNALPISDDQGFRLFGPGDINGTEALVNSCRGIFENAKRSGVLAEQVKGKPFLVPVAARQQDLMMFPEIQEFVLSDQIIDTAIKYFGEIPILSELQLLWSPPNDSNVKSQQYHFDAEDYRQLKVFVNIFDTTPKCGPFTLIGSRVSADVAAKARYEGGRRSRMTDNVVEEKVAKDAVVTVLGSAGSGVFVDTSRCLHYGSRGNQKERLVLLIQFMSFYAPKVEPVDWTPASSYVAHNLDSVRKLVLQL